MNEIAASAQLQDAEISRLIESLLGGVQRILGQKLAGFYLHGSLVSGDFDPKISDIDLAAAVLDVLDPGELGRLETLHAEIAREYPHWDDRIEVAYMPVSFLRGSNSPLEIAVISPGEPFHALQANPEDWILNRYLIHSKGVVLYGPDPKELVLPVSQLELLHCIREHCRQWPEWVLELRHLKGQAYSILTLCRALYTLRNGDIVSKKQAALWAQQELPQWESLIQQALIWRETDQNDLIEDPAFFPETQKFVDTIVEQLLSERRS
jgi:predicted nucleotidyltransferase